MATIAGDPGVAMITGRDGYYVRAWRRYGAWELVAGRDDVVGGLFVEWSDCETDQARHNRARRMIARARREYGRTS